MVLNLADFGKSWKSLQTVWNGSKAQINGFLTALATLCVDLGWIRKSRNLADFEQNPWAIAHGFEHGGFLQSWKSLQTLWNGSNAPINSFLTALATLCVHLRGIREGRKLADFEQKPWAIAHGFEHGRFWQVLEIAPNSLKRFQRTHKLIFNCFGDSFCRFRVNSQGSKFGRFWAKKLGYSPDFEHGGFW